MPDRHVPDSMAPATPRPRARKTFRTAHEARAWRRRVVGYGLFGAAFVLMVNAIIGENGYLDTVRARREHERLAADLAVARAKTEALREQIRRLEREPAALEEAARKQLNLIRPGERVVILRDREAPPKPPKGR